MRRKHPGRLGRTLGKLFFTDHCLHNLQPGDKKGDGQGQKRGGPTAQHQWLIPWWGSGNPPTPSSSLKQVGGPSPTPPTSHSATPWTGWTGEGSFGEAAPPPPNCMEGCLPVRPDPPPCFFVARDHVTSHTAHCTDTCTSGHKHVCVN